MKRLILMTILLALFCSATIYANPTGVCGYVRDPARVIIYVGDSRAMQMSHLSKNKRQNFVFVFSNGGNLSCINPVKGSRWIGNRLKATLNKYPYAPVVFALGVNGNGNPSSNINRTRNYDYYINNYPTHRYIISTVGGTGKIGGSYKNKNVRLFNTLLKKKYGQVYDCYQFLEDGRLINPGKNNKGTRDGLHYKNSVYAKILIDCRKKIQGCS